MPFIPKSFPANLPSHRRTLHRAIRPSLALLLAVGFAAPAMLAAEDQPTGQAGQAAPDRPLILDLPAQPLSSALQTVAQAAGLHLVIAADLVAGRQATALRGAISARAAFDALLAPHRLGYGLVDGQTLVVRTVAAGDRGGNAGQESLVVATDRPSTGDWLVVEGRADESAVIPEDRGTALFGSSALDELPLGVNIIGHRDLENRQVRTLHDALETDPAYTRGWQSNSNSTALLRGFDNNRWVVDGVPTQRFYETTPVELLERVEVLRGPAAFRYGFIAPGGAINLTTKRPTDQAFASVTTSVDGFGTVGGHVDIGGRTGADDRVGYRINLATTTGDTHVRGDTDQNRLVLGLAMDYRVDDRTTATVAYHRYRYELRGEGDAGVRRLRDVNGGVLPGIDARSNLGAPWMNSRIEGQGLSGSVLSRPTDDLELYAGLTYSESADDYLGFFHGDIEPNGDVLSGGGTYAGYGQTADLNLTTYGTQRFATGPLRHALTVGFTVARSDSTSRFPQSMLGLPTPYSIYDYTIPRPTVGPTDLFLSLTEEYGGFISDHLTIAEDWHVLAGVRWSRQVYRDVEPLGEESANSAVSPLLGVLYDVNDHLGVYANYATSLERGGRAPGTASNPNEQMPAGVSQQYEIGSKWEILPGVEAIDVALFQITRPREYDTGIGTEYVQDGEQRHRGGEALWRGRFWEPLEITGGVQYLDARSIDLGDPAIDGDRIPGVARLQESLGAELHLPWIDGLYLNGLATAQGRREVNEANDDQEMPGFMRFDLGLRYETAYRDVELIGRLNVDNVADTYHVVGASHAELIGPPRTVVASLEATF